MKQFDIHQQKYAAADSPVLLSLSLSFSAPLSCFCCFSLLSSCYRVCVLCFFVAFLLVWRAQRARVCIFVVKFLFMFLNDSLFYLSFLSWLYFQWFLLFLSFLFKRSEMTVRGVCVCPEGCVVVGRHMFSWRWWTRRKNDWNRTIWSVFFNLRLCLLISVWSHWWHCRKQSTQKWSTSTDSQTRLSVQCGQF
jgi:hypothetical protein